jgi:hypothetical protein
MAQERDAAVALLGEAIYIGSWTAPQLDEWIGRVERFLGEVDEAIARDTEQWDDDYGAMLATEGP